MKKFIQIIKKQLTEEREEKKLMEEDKGVKILQELYKRLFCDEVESDGRVFSFITKKQNIFYIAKLGCRTMDVNIGSNVEQAIDNLYSMARIKHEKQIKDFAWCNDR